MNNNNIINGVIALAALIVTQIILRYIGMDNIPIRIILSLLVLVCILMVIGLLKNGTMGMGFKYNLIVTVLMIITCITTGVMITVIKCYPELFLKHGTVILFINLGSFFVLCMYIIIVKIMSNLKSK